MKARAGLIAAITALSLSIGTTSMANVAPTTSSISDSATASDQGMEIESVVATADAIAVEATSTAVDGSEIEYELEIDAETSNAQVEVSSDIPELDGASVNLTIHEATEDLIWFTAVDAATGETVEYRSDVGVLSAVPLVIALPAIGSMLKALVVAVGATIVISGVTYVIATEAIPAIREAVRKNRNTPHHYQVTLRNGSLYFGKGLSISEAASRFRSGGNTWSTTPAGAKQVAQNARAGLRPVGPEKDTNGSGKYCHYHGYNRVPSGVHAFYGVAGQWIC